MYNTSKSINILTMIGKEWSKWLFHNNYNRNAPPFGGSQGKDPVIPRFVREGGDEVAKYESSDAKKHQCFVAIFSTPAGAPERLPNLWMLTYGSICNLFLSLLVLEFTIGLACLHAFFVSFFCVSQNKNKKQVDVRQSLRFGCWWWQLLLITPHSKLASFRNK